MMFGHCSTGFHKVIAKLLFFLGQQRRVGFVAPLVIISQFYEIVSTRWVWTDWTQLDFAVCSRTTGLCRCASHFSTWSNFHSWASLHCSSLLKTWEATLCQGHCRFSSFWKGSLVIREDLTIFRVARFRAWSRLPTVVDHLLSLPI